MAAPIAGVNWRAVRLVRECRGGSARREGVFFGRCSEIFGLGERLGCILNVGGRLYRRSTGTFLIRPCSGTRATLETAYIRRGVLDVRIHGVNDVLAGSCAALSSH